jgi:hypothetical protein
VITDYTKCPKCAQNIIEKEHKLKLILAQAYQTMGMEEFIAYKENMEDEIQHQKEYEPSSLSECYGIGIDGNTFKISYKAKCMLCGFEYSYNVVKDI